MDFPLKIVNYVIGTIILCKQKMIESEKKQGKINGNIVMLFHYFYC